MILRGLLASFDSGIQLRTALLTLSLCLFSSPILFSQELSIALYYDDLYVDICQQNTCEAFTLKEFLESRSYDVETFNGLGSSDFEQGLECHEVFFMPETEAGDFASDISDLTADVIRDFVNQGGVLFIMGSDGLNSSSSNTAENLNAIFNFDLENIAFTSSGFCYKNDNLTDPYVSGLPDSLRNFTTTNFIDNLPPDSEILYLLDGDRDAVVHIPYGSGDIVFLGWSFFNAGPIGTQGPGRWAILIDQLIAEYNNSINYPDCASCDTKAPTSSRTSSVITRYLDADGQNFLPSSFFVSDYSDNCAVQGVKVVSDSLFSCSSSYTDQIRVSATDPSGNTVIDTFDLILIDTISPEFIDFPDDVTIECLSDVNPSDVDTLETFLDINETIDLDSLSILLKSVSSPTLHTGNEILRVEFYVEGDFNNLENFWIRVKDIENRSSLLFDGNCNSSGEIRTWFGSQGSDIDCAAINRNTRLFHSINSNIGLLDAAPYSTNFDFEIINLDDLQGVITRLGVRYIFTSDLRQPKVNEACNYTLSYIDLDNRINCPTGTVKRRFIVQDESGNSIEQTQLIIIEDSKPVDISFPSDYFFTCLSNINYSDSLEPENLPAGHDFPVIFDECRVYDYSYSDRLISSCGANGIEFERTWKVESDCEPGKEYLFKQKIGVLDTVAPEIDPVDPYQVFVESETCLSGSNFFFPNQNDLVIHDCDENITIDMRVIDSFGVQFRGDELSAGTYFVEISATDQCGNIGLRLVTVNLIDISPPEITCKNIATEYLLDQSGKAEVCGRLLLTNIDENCGIERFQVSLKPTFNPDDECLEVGCDIVDQVRFVYVRAVDVSGNQDVCMAQILVKDRMAPSLLCSDIIMSCDVPLDLNNIPLPTAIDNCTIDPYVECSPFSFVGSQCDSVYSRICFSRDESSNRTPSCTQYLRRVDTSTLLIDWPEERLSLSCGASTDPAMTGEPIILDGCGRYGVTYSDNTSSLCALPNLFRIERSWSVRNLCSQEIERFDQVIMVEDLEAPVFTYPNSSELEFNIVDFACERIVTIIPTADDNCSPDIYYSNSVTGTNDFNLNLPVGSNEVVFYAEDICGNLDSIMVTITVTENKSPFVRCKQGQKFYMNQVSFVDIYPQDIIDTAFDLCTSGDKLDFFISKVLTNGQDIGRQPFIRYECNELGFNQARLYARDESKNLSYCDVQVNVIDTFRNCPNGDFYDIAGMIFNELREPLGGAKVYVDGLPSSDPEDGRNAHFRIKALAKDNEYDISMVKDINHDNGITALDMALIQSHNLRLQALSSPYKNVAADVNNDQDISILDIIIIRQMLLGIIDDFVDVPSWRFLPESYEFPVPQLPFSSTIPFSESVYLGGESLSDVNFIGVKMGDVNNSADMNFARQSRQGDTDLTLEYKLVDDLTYHFKLGGFENWKSAQIYLDFDEFNTSKVKLIQSSINAENIQLSEDGLRFVFSNVKAYTLGQIEFEISTVSNVDVSELIRLSSDRMTLVSSDLNAEYIPKLVFENENAISERRDCYRLKNNVWRDNLVIENLCPDEKYEMSLFDVSGITWESTFKTNQSQFTFQPKAKLNSGIYFLEIRSETGEITRFKTFRSN